MKASLYLALLSTAYAQSCTDFHLVYARGTGDLSGFGTVGTQVNNNLIQCLGDIYSGFAIPYPANFTIGVSSAVGIQMFSQYLTEYHSACPETQFFVAGYSQGAIVLHGALGAISDDVKAQVIGGSTYGDPFRNNTEGLPNWLSFCNVGDPVCINGNNFNAHLGYIGDGTALLSSQFFEKLTPVGNTTEECNTPAAYEFPGGPPSTTPTSFPIPTGGAGSSPSSAASVTASSSKSYGSVSSSAAASSSSRALSSSSSAAPTAPSVPASPSPSVPASGATSLISGSLPKAIAALSMIAIVNIILM